MNVERVAAIGAFAVVAAGIAVGFAAIGPPQHVRLVELDRRRVDDLLTIDRNVRDLADDGDRPGPNRLPARALESWPRDPVTREPYGYRRESRARFELCATFALPADPSESPLHWDHGAGRTCYRLNTQAEEPDVPEPVVTRTAAPVRH